MRLTRMPEKNAASVLRPDGVERAPEGRAVHDDRRRSRRARRRRRTGRRCAERSARHRCSITRCGKPVTSFCPRTTSAMPRNIVQGADRHRDRRQARGSATRKPFSPPPMAPTVEPRSPSRRRRRCDARRHIRTPRSAETEHRGHRQVDLAGQHDHRHRQGHDRDLDRCRVRRRRSSSLRPEVGVLNDAEHHHRDQDRRSSAVSQRITESSACRRAGGCRVPGWCRRGRARRRRRRWPCHRDEWTRHST